MATKQAEPSHPLPGLDVVGRGVLLKPHQPYVLRPILTPHSEMRQFHSVETGQTYSVPKGYEVNESPPMPATQALSRVVIEESHDRFEKQFALDTKVAASVAIFSIDANAGQASQVRSEEDAFYALRGSFVPLWALYLEADPVLPAQVCAKLPKKFDYSKETRHIYDDFFERVGTHYVLRAWVGGQAKLIFTVLKSSNMSKQDIHAGVKASFSGFGDGEGSSSLKENKEQLQNNSECTVWGKGGAEEQLAALSSLNEEKYNAWLATVHSNPQAIELELKGIWTLVQDPQQSRALMDAYKAATTFEPISAAFIAPELNKKSKELEMKAYFLRGDKYFVYSGEEAEAPRPGTASKGRQPAAAEEQGGRIKSITKKWPKLKELQQVGQFGAVDAAFHEAGVLFMFSQGKCLSLNLENGEIVDGPKKISEVFPGVEFDRIDAVLIGDLDAVYFFHGSKYLRFNMLEHKVHEGEYPYPQPVSKRWVGVTFDRIDAAIYRPDTGKAYFFKDDKHIRYDMCTYRSDPGYPRAIAGSYVEDWRP